MVLPVEILENRFGKDPPLIGTLTQSLHDLFNKSLVVVRGIGPVHGARFGDEEDFLLVDLVGGLLLQVLLGEYCEELREHEGNSLVPLTE